MRNRSDRIIAFAMMLPSLILLAIFVYYFIGETIYTSVTAWGERKHDIYPPLAENPDKGVPEFNSPADFQKADDTILCRDIPLNDPLRFQCLNPDDPDESLSCSDLEEPLPVQCDSYQTITDNYEKLLTDLTEFRFRDSLVNTFFFTLFFLAGCIGLGFVLALLLDQKIIGEGVFRTIFLFPMALSFIVTGTIWGWLLQPGGGINILPEKLLGLDPLKYKWVSSTEQLLSFQWADIPLYLTYLGIAMLAFAIFNYLSQENDRIGVSARLLMQFAIIAGVVLLLMTLFSSSTDSQTARLIAMVAGALWVGYQIVVNRETATMQDYVPRRWTPVTYLSAGVAVLIFLYLMDAWDKIFLPLDFPTAETPKGYNAALSGIVIAAVWQMSGYTMAMFLAGIRGIPEELREAARVDGCTEIGVYRTIILPMMRPIILSALIVLGHISLKIFDLVWAMSGPDNAKTIVPGVLVYTSGFRSNRFAIGASIAVIILFLVALVIIPYLWNSMRSEARK